MYGKRRRRKGLLSLNIPRAFVLSSCHLCLGSPSIPVSNDSKRDVLKNPNPPTIPLLPRLGTVFRRKVRTPLLWHTKPTGCSTARLPSPGTLPPVPCQGPNALQGCSSPGHCPHQVLCKGCPQPSQCQGRADKRARGLLLPPSNPGTPAPSFPSLLPSL